jgi:hypothetical protein
MSTVQTNGSAVTSTSTKNNGGAVIANSATATNIESRPFVLPSVGVFASQVVNGVNTTKAISIGVFAYSTNRPVAMKLTENLAAINNDFLVFGANDPASIKSINYLLVDNASGNPEEGPFVDGTRSTLNLTAYRQNKLNILTGKYEAGYPVVSKDYFLGSNNTSGDRAAKVTRLVPGSLVYKISKKVPVQKDYSEKTG